MLPVFFPILSLIVFVKGRRLLSKFHHNNYSLCDFLFLIIYFIEQFLFLLLYNLYVEYRGLWIGLIVLLVITTASLERFMMNIRQRKNAKTIRDLIEERKRSSGIIRNLKKEYNYLKDFIRENL